MSVRMIGLLLPMQVAAFWLAPTHAPAHRLCNAKMGQWRSEGSNDAYGGHSHDAFSGDDDEIAKDSDLVFTILDKDGDGGVSKEELIGHLTRAGYDAGEVSTWFEMDLDADKDGLLSREELRSAFLRTPELRTAPGLGTNLNGEIPQKIRMDATNFIAAADTGREGFITSAELEAFMAKRGFSKDSIAHVFAQLDLDGNGSLSRDEIAEVFLKYSALRLALRDA